MILLGVELVREFPVSLRRRLRGQAVTPGPSASAEFFTGTGRGPTPRAAVLADLGDALDQADLLDQGMRLTRPGRAAEVRALRMVAEQTIRQIDEHGRPFNYQTRGLAGHCVRLLEREVGS